MRLCYYSDVGTLAGYNRTRWLPHFQSFGPIDLDNQCAMAVFAVLNAYNGRIVEGGLEFFVLKLDEPLQRYLLTCQAKTAFLGRFFCAGQQQL